MITILEVPHENLRPADWRTVHTLKPDLKVVAQSILDHGWLAPIVAQAETGIIIDGYHRWVLAHRNRPILRKFKGVVPVHFIEVDTIDAMVLHLQLNRGRGQVIPRYSSLLVRDILKSKKYTEDQVKSMFNMGIDEFTLLLNGNLLKQRNIAEHVYSQAWVPIESNGKDFPTFERPPNPDR